MGLFSKKKEPAKTSEQVLQHIENLENAPEFPTQEDIQEFPVYEPTITDIKSEISKGMDEPEIPVREKNPMRRNMASVTVQEKTEDTSIRRFSADEEKPLFVQIDRYKEVMHSINAIKAKIEDIEGLIKNFENLKNEEDEKLESWKKDLYNIKEKLLSIDKDLFEV